MFGVVEKNASIGDNSIIGASSIVTKRFDDTNIAIGGNPAKIIKKDVNWDWRSPQQYLIGINVSD